jgi:hypothetical protein
MRKNYRPQSPMQAARCRKWKPVRLCEIQCGQLQFEVSHHDIFICFRDSAGDVVANVAIEKSAFDKFVRWYVKPQRPVKKAESGE